MSRVIDGVLRDSYRQVIDDVEIIVGKIYGDKKGRFLDGTVIHTSRIQDIEVDKDGQKFVKTLNSVYLLES